jgi:hypothetical protein
MSDHELTTEQDWLDAIKHAEDTGETGPLVRIMRMPHRVLSYKVRNALADLFESFVLVDKK